MRIDAHQHFWRYNAGEYGWIDETMTSLRRDFLPADVKREMDAAGFDACVAVQARQTAEETRWLLDLAETHPFIIGVVGWVDLQSAGVEAELERLGGHPKLVGIRHIVQSEPDDFLARPAFLRGLARLERFDLAYDVLIHARHLPAAAAFVERFPRQRFVLDHLAKPEIRRGAIDDWRRGLGRLAACPHVHAKLSGLVTEADWRLWTPDQIRPYLDVALDCFGANRLMIGSDWPVCTVAASYARTLDVVLRFLDRCTGPEREAILGGTAQRFWNLPARERCT
jgi:L-fuconolactonase